MVDWSYEWTVYFDETPLIEYSKTLINKTTYEYLDQSESLKPKMKGDLNE